MYAIYGWAATAKTYKVSFFDMLRRTTVPVSASITKNTIAYDSDDRIPGILIVTPLFSGASAKPYTFPINNPPSLSNLRWTVRAALNDTEAADGVDYKYPETPKFPDSEIDTQLREAIGLINRYVRRPVILESRINILRQDVIAKFVDVTSVSIYNENTSLWTELPGNERRRHRNAMTQSHSWEVVNGQLRIRGSLAEDSRIEVAGEMMYGQPFSDTDELEIDPIDYDILSIYAQGKCMLRIAGQSAQLDRWKEEGKRNDNPITPVAKLLLQEAETRISNRRSPRAARRILQ